MDELKFVLKGLGIALLVTILLQFKIGNETLETKSDHWIHQSSVGIFLNQTAVGAVTISKKASVGATQLWAKAFGKSNHAHHQHEESASSTDSEEHEMD